MSNKDELNVQNSILSEQRVMTRQQRQQMQHQKHQAERLERKIERLKIQWGLED